MSTHCGMELCDNWTGDGDVCWCAHFEYTDDLYVGSGQRLRALMESGAERAADEYEYRVYLAEDDEWDSPVRTLAEALEHEDEGGNPISRHLVQRRNPASQWEPLP